VLRTRSPVYSPLRAFSLDLHVLGTPPAFVLSQDQTLQLRIRFPSAFLAQRSRLQGRARQCTQSIAVSAIPSWTCYPVFRDRPTPSNRTLPTTDPSPPFRRRIGRATYRPPRTPSRAANSVSRQPRTAGVAVSSRAIQGCQEAALPPRQIREFRRNLGHPGRVFQGGLTTSCAPDGSRSRRRTPLATRGRPTVPAAPRAPWRTPPCTGAGSLRTRPP
jgi:hypothetical protein